MIERLRHETIAGFRVASISRQECVQCVLSWLESATTDRPRFIACANPHSLEMARHDPSFARALDQADLLIPDGVGILIASWLRRGGMRERVTGMDMFLAVNRELNRRAGARYFFLGSTVETLIGLGERIPIQYPRIVVSGVYSPPFSAQFSDAENELMLEAIGAASPDILWVGMTAPKQEKWIADNLSRLEVPVVAAIGAVFDVAGGLRRRAPRWMRAVGGEWLFRLTQEPRRLWRRTFVSAPRFLAREALALVMSGTPGGKRGA